MTTWSHPFGLDKIFVGLACLSLAACDQPTPLESAGEVPAGYWQAVIKLPGGERAATRVQPAVQLADVRPTLTHVAGATGAGGPGRDLLADGLAPVTIYSESYRARLHFGWSELLTVIDYPYQYIEAPEPELYDLLRAFYRQDPAVRRGDGRS